MSEESTRMYGPPDPGQQRVLADAWRRLGRAATAVALITSPAFCIALHQSSGLPWWACVVLSILAVAAFRGMVDLVCFRFITRPSLYGADERMKAEDALFRRRRWYWRTRLRRIITLAVAAGLLLLVMMLFVQWFLGVNTGFFNSFKAFRDTVPPDQRGQYAINLLFNVLIFGLFFVFNFFIFLGPLLLMGIMQMKGFEPGDADWGVKLDDVRGQKEPKQEVERVITLWSAGEEFKRAGGRPERGLLLIGAPGTGKTMLSKAIATSFNSPIVTMPGSGFAQTFIGIDVVVVMMLVAKARRLARKWGGQCMIFIDEIDAVGRRRQGLGGLLGGLGGASAPRTGVEPIEDYLFFGRDGARTASGDLMLETRAWRDRVFAERDPGPRAPYQLPAGIRKFMMPGMGSMALNQLLVQMDGMDSPPLVRKAITKKVNTFLDGLYVVPSKVRGRSLRLPSPKPRPEQVYFIGATNVNIDELDPALLRPGRMGRHIYFRTPNKDDRKDIFDLYLGKVAHDAELDTDRRREELARITGGYSPAMIEQVCSMALTQAHAEGRGIFEWQDIIESMTTIESGIAVGIEYIPEESRATAIHEAGHAVASHVYMDDVESTRLSIRMRGGSLGHHSARKKEEKFASWRHEEVGELVWTLGAMAAEHVFYGENSNGVGGDLQSATTTAAYMVGMCGMGPEPIDLSEVPFASEDERREAEEEYVARFERIGQTIMNRARGSTAMQGDPIASILGDGAKRRAAAIILGQAYITAVCLIRHNRESVARVADELVRRKELHGDEVIALLDAAHLRAPQIDITDETIWPKL